MPDPQDEATFLRSKLDWAQRDREPYRGMLAWYRELIALRRARPELTDPRLDRVQADYDEAGRWLVVRRGRLRIAANLGPQRRPAAARAAPAPACSPRPPPSQRSADTVVHAPRLLRRHRDSGRPARVGVTTQLGGYSGSLMAVAVLDEAYLINPRAGSRDSIRKARSRWLIFLAVAGARKSRPPRACFWPLAT